jgi:hypothetical protein
MLVQRIVRIIVALLRLIAKNYPQINHDLAYVVRNMDIDKRIQQITETDSQDKNQLADLGGQSEYL